MLTRRASVINTGRHCLSSLGNQQSDISNLHLIRKTHLHMLCLFGSAQNEGSYH